MLYNKEEFPQYVKTAGKVTIVTAVTGLLVFIVAFMFDVGTQEFNKAVAQSQGQATTTLTVLNIPPVFILNAFEVPDSSTTSPTNSGDVQSWQAVGFDSNNAPYFLLICSTNASPTPAAASSTATLGTAPPSCNGGIQWGVSVAASSGAPAVVSTTTTEGGNFAEVNEWYAWVCDDDPVSPQCSLTFTQGPTSTVASTSPFHVNRRPVLSGASNNGPVDPGDVITFFSTSSDPDTAGGDDEIFITVCRTNTQYSTTTNTCSDFIASSTLGVLDNASTSYQVVIPTRDQLYSAFVYIHDEHGHVATSTLSNNFTVNNVAPFATSIVLQGGNDLILTNPATQTPGFTLDFTLVDNNSCLNSASSSEISTSTFVISVFRSDERSTSTCDGSAGAYDPNNCYSSGVGPATWNLSCNATTTCGGATDSDLDFACTFPLWFLADPTDESNPNIPTAFGDDFWVAAVAGVDDDFATGTLATTTGTQNLRSFSALDILAANITYAPTAPGDDTDNVNATSTALNVGNTGLDQEVIGTDMCPQFSATTTCPASPTSTIPADQQVYATSTFTYGDAGTFTLASTATSTLQIDILKTTSTNPVNFQRGVTYWGIAVPGTIALSGDYSGLNTFYAVSGDPDDWE